MNHKEVAKNLIDEELRVYYNEFMNRYKKKKKGNTINKKKVIPQGNTTNKKVIPDKKMSDKKVIPNKINVTTNNKTDELDIY